MVTLDIHTLNRFREKTFRSSPENRISSIDQALDFINERGYVFFWPIKGINFPSLWVSAAGDRLVIDAHDDPGHITWSWKDELLPRKKCYYGRILYHRNAFLSLSATPYFYALTPNYGNPETDYLDQYQAGTMTMEAKSIYEALLEKGPMDTISLRKEARLSNTSNYSRFERGLSSLQSEMKIIPTGVAPVGAWKYAFIYDLVHHVFPQIIEEAHSISENQARDFILDHYFQAVGAAELKQITHLFKWKEEIVIKSLDRLRANATIAGDISLPNSTSSLYCLNSLLN